MSDAKGDGPSEGLTRADFRKWARRDLWHIDEGAQLILGFEPLDDSWPESEGFYDIYNTATRSINSGVLRANRMDFVSPRDFLAWAREKEYFVPTELEGLVNRFHPNAEGRPQVAAGNSETPDERRARITARHRELKASGNRHPTKTVAEEARLSESRVRQLMRPVPKAR